MPARRLLLLPAIAAVVSLSNLAPAEPRVWRDSSGKFEIEAELVSVDDGRVTLRRTSGKEIKVPIDRLSSEDREFLDNESSGSKRKRGRRPDGSAAKGEAKIEQLAEAFFADLRTEERAEATAMLTPKARKLAEEDKSPLKGLPTPDKHKNAIRVRNVRVERNTAFAPVSVRVNRRVIDTILHLRREKEEDDKEGDKEGEWGVFAISASQRGGEKTISFEVEPGSENDADPLEALVGKPMPLTGILPNGRSFDVRQLRGKVVLVDFWATWCGPCRAEMKNIAESYRKYHDQGFEVVAVSVDRDLEALEEFVGKQRPPWVVLADNHPKNRTSMGDAYRVRSLPSLALLGPDGTVVAAHCRGKELAPAIEKALAGSAAGSGRRRSATRGDRVRQR